MTCKTSENCVYYKTYGNKPSPRKHRLLIESYCEGSLQANCRRSQFEAEYHTSPPDELAPNGYHIGTHKKLRTNNIRRFERHKIKNGACMLQVLGTKKTFSAWILDISEGGVRLDLNIHPKELEITPEESLLKILGYSVESIPFPLTKEIVKPVWQNEQVMGCSFVSSPM